MTPLFLILFLSSLIFLFIGFFRPKTSLFWYRKERTRKLSSLIYGAGTIVFFILFGITAPDVKKVQRNIDEVDQKNLSQQQKDSISAAEKQNKIQNTLTAGQLVAAYNKNEVAADKAFKGTTFYVTGYIDRIGKDMMDNSYVTIKSGDLIRRVQCFVEDQDTLAKLQPGQKITVYGECNGLMMNVLMKDCKLVDN